MMSAKKIIVAVAAFSAVMFTALAALAQSVVDPGTDPLAFLGLVKQAIAGRQWAVLAMLGVIGAVAGLRFLSGKLAKYWAGKVAGKVFAFFTTDRGGVIMTLLVGVAGALIPVFSGAAFTVQAVLDGIMLGITAAGGYQMVKRAIWPAGEDRAQLVNAVGDAAGVAAGAAAAADPAAALAAANAKKPQ